jgi:hypothetical protein
MDDGVARRRALAQLALGCLQMFGASASLALVIQTGLNRWSLTAVGATTAVTLVSRSLFGQARSS